MAKAKKTSLVAGPIEWVVDKIVHYYWAILLACIVVSYFSFNLALGLKLDTNIISLMPDGVASVENLRTVINKTGGYSHAMVLVESPDPAAAERFLEDLRAAVLKLDWISSAEYTEDSAFFERNRLLYVDVEDLHTINKRLAARIDYEKKNISFKVEETPVEINIRGAKGVAPSIDFADIEDKYKGKKADKKEKRLFQNDQGDLTVLVILPKGSTTDVDYARRVVNDLQRVIDTLQPAGYHKAMKASIGGRVRNLVAKTDAIKADLKSSAVWSIGGILLVLILFYRRLMAVFYIGIPLLIGFTWTFGLTELVLGRLNLITIFLILILFGLGIDFGIHNLARYDEIRKNGGNLKAALMKVYSETGQASLWAGVTTIAGFFSLMITDFRAFYEFGFIAGTGVALTLISMYLVFPALMVLAEQIGIYRISRRGYGVPDDDNWVFPWVTPTLIVGICVTVIFILALPKLGFENDFGKLRTRIAEISELNQKIKEVFPLRSDKAVVFVQDLKDVGSLVDEVEKIRLSRPPEEATIEKVKSIFNVVPSAGDQVEHLQVIDDIHVQILEAIQLLEDFGDRDDEQRKQELEDLLENFGVSELKPQDLPSSLQRVYTGIAGAGGYLVYIYNRKSTSKLDEAQAFIDDIREIKVNGKTFYPATETMVFVDMLNLMKKDALLAISAVLIAIVIVLLLALRSVTHTALVLFPVVVGMLWMLGIMAVFDIRMNVFNMVVLPTVLGIGIDNGIHIFHRYRVEGMYRLHNVILTTGGAAFLTTLTTMLGFAGTLTASNQGLRSLGLVACVGLGACMVSSLTVFPALLQYLENRYAKVPAVT